MDNVLLDDSFSPFRPRGLKNSSNLLTPVNIKKDIAYKLSLKSHSKATGSYITQTPESNLLKSESTCGKPKQVSASFLFSSCKKKLLDSDSPSGHTILVADSSDEEFFAEDKDISNLSNPLLESDAVQESLEEYSMIRKWLQNADSFDSPYELTTSSPVYSPKISRFPVLSKLNESDIPDSPFSKSLKPFTKKVQEVIDISSDEDDDQFENFLKELHNNKKDSTRPLGKEPLKTATTLYIRDSSLSEDSFDSSFVTQTLKERLLKHVNPKVASPLTKSLDEEVKFSLPCDIVKTQTKKQIKPFNEDSDLEDIFGNLNIEEKPVAPPKSTVKRITKKATKEVAVNKSPGSYDSFLQSLSENCPQERRHPEAVPFIKSFRKMRSELTQKLFSLFNEAIFKNQLPRDFSVTWNNRLTRTAGYCRHFTRRENGASTFESRIELSVKVVDTPCRLRDTLVHEMCHAATWMIDNCRGGHGPLWRKYANLAVRAFPELPAITRCHNYEISYKFYYNCTKCSFSTGRHSKSIDVTTHVCPLCLGKLQLSKESQSKENVGPTASVPRTPRTPNAFALFVKEHYATTKSSRPDLAHAAVMKVLSSMFAEAKKQAA